MSENTPQEFDMANVTWESPGEFRVHFGVFYDDRPLTRWEWFRVKILRRRDPRLIATFGDGGSAA